MPQKSHNCNLWMAYIHLFDTFPKICFWLMVDFLASGYYSVSCYFSIIHYFSLNRVRCCSILYHYHYVLCCHIIVWRDENEDDMCVCLAVIIKGLSFIFSEIEFTQYTKAQSTKLHSYWNCYKMKLLFRYFDIKVRYLISIFSIYQMIHCINRIEKLYSIYSNGQQT